MNHSILKSTHVSGTRKLPGFTLVEILTVIAIITILMGAGAIGIGNINAGKNITSAVATCESLFEETRTIAVSKRCKARLMINVEDRTNDNYLRKIIIVHQKIEPDGTIDVNTWVVASRGYDMPKGTYFSKVYSSSGDGNRIPEIELQNVKTDFLGDYAYYEFNGEGIYDDPGASFVVGSGVRPVGQEPKSTKGAARDFAGFMIWRNGRTSIFRSPEQIQNLPTGDDPFNF